MGGGDVNVYFKIKPNFIHPLGFTMYKKFYYIINRAEALTYNANPYPWM